MDIGSEVSTSGNCESSSFYLDPSIVKMEPVNEASIIVIKQEIISEDETEETEGEYYSYIDTADLEEMGESLILGTENSENSDKTSLQNSDPTKYVVIYKEVEEDSSGILHLRLVNEKPLIKPLKIVKKPFVLKKEQKKCTTLKNLATSKKIGADVEYPYKCGECEAMFEVRSHLVMHELQHEKLNKRSRPNKTRTDSVTAINQVPILHICKDCGATFQHKGDLLRHHDYHENDQNSNCSCRKSLRTTSDLCRCFVRECQSCHRKFFAAIKLGNWNACIKCFFLGGTDPEQVNDEKLDNPNIKTIDMNKKIEITNVKKLCYCCGKMCSNVIADGTSWICYNCWNTKLRGRQTVKRIQQNYPQLQNRMKYKRTNCMYCLQLLPFKSLESSHQCYHKSVYLKNQNGTRVKIENNDYFEVKVPGDEIGQHFLSSVDTSLGSPFLAENSVSKHELRRTLVIPSTQLKARQDSRLNAVPSNTSKPSDWTTYSDDDDNDDDNYFGEDDKIFEETKAVEVLQEEYSSTSRIILCDKTGELIHLNSETSLSQQSENISVQL